MEVRSYDWDFLDNIRSHARNFSEEVEREDASRSTENSCHWYTVILIVSCKSVRKTIKTEAKGNGNTVEEV